MGRKKVKKREGVSRAIPFRAWLENDVYITKLMAAREYSSINMTINKIVENHKTAFEIYRLKAKEKAKKLRDDARKLMQDFELTENDME